MKNRALLGATALTAVLALALGGCVSKVDSGTGSASTIKIGVFEPMTGANGAVEPWRSKARSSPISSTPR